MNDRLLAHHDHPLAAHLGSVGKLAKGFAGYFGGADQAWLAGILHDVGKAEDTFQDRIAGRNADKHPHAHHGAALALDKQLWPVAFAINGHHAGLHDRSDLQHVPSKWSIPARRCAAMLTGDTAWEAQGWPVADFGKTLPDWLAQITASTAGERGAKMRAVDFYTRMLFSALVDADRLDTEEANRAEGPQANVLKRSGWRFGPSGLAANGAMESLIDMLDTAIGERVEAARQKKASDAVMGVRAGVLAACKAKATAERGVFTLAVPTGGGKTLASVAFALHHIAHHNKLLPVEDVRRLRRIIVVIPYLNIIQQTSRELRMVFGDLVWVKDGADPLTGQKVKHPVKEEEGAWLKNSDPNHKPLILEHHSQATDPEVKGAAKTDNDTDGYDKERPLRQLAAENWDAPIIVTTSVQFFDSLFSRRPADARKLHNICQSVLIFDEVQTLPPLLLQPILDALKELTSHQRPYGCSLVLCTATQPALAKTDEFEFGFENPTPIICPNTTAAHCNLLKRVDYHGLAKDNPPPEMDNAALAVATHGAPRHQALAILNTRKQARALFDVLKEKARGEGQFQDAVFHLSTWMYPAHRLQVLAEVTKRLNEHKPCLLVSTQCIEAGVDVDFPAVWRAFGPYDSIVQAAGRCNRNGALKDQTGQPVLGQVQVFQPADAAAPTGIYASAMQTADLLRKMDRANPDAPKSFETYFRLLYQATVPDLGGCAVQSAREKLHFEEVSTLFNFIDADTIPLLIGDAEMVIPGIQGTKKVKAADWISQARLKTYLTAEEWRSIQPCVVGLSFPESEMTKAFLRDSNSERVFKDDDPVRGLHLLKANSPLYHDGPNECGLDVECQALRNLGNYAL